MENNLILPDLTQSLQGRDAGFLQIIAELWGLDLETPDLRQGTPALIAALRDPLLVEEIVDSLPAEGNAALSDLYAHAGRLPWALFARRYGEVRRYGPARRDREKPYRSPASASEMLWYRGLIGRTFFDSPTGPQEFAYIPQELYAQMPALTLPSEAPLGRPASPGEQAVSWAVHDRILDHACTLLAALRTGLAPDEIAALASGWDFRGAGYPLTERAMAELLRAVGLLDARGQPEPEAARRFLAASRAEALAWLVQKWLPSQAFNELRLLPGITCEGEWRNDPRLARQTILALISELPGDSWRQLPSFIADIHAVHPDFQRPEGDYDSWFIRADDTGEFVQGFADWERVEGQLIRFLITGPFFWLGLTELAGPDKNQPPAAFRLSAWSQALLNGEPPPGLPEEKETLTVHSDGRVLVPRLVPRAARYLVARFCDWEGEQKRVYQYRLTPLSLERARKNGLRLAHLFTLLQKHAGGMPAGISAALNRWEKHGAEVRVDRLVVLRVSKPEVLQTIRSSRAARFLGDPLGPTAVVVNPGAVNKVLAIIHELGFLGMVTINE